MTPTEALIPIERLHERLIYDPDSGEFIWRKMTRPMTQSDRAAREVIRWNSRHAGKPAFAQTEARGRSLVGRIDGVRLKAHRVAWAMVHGEWPNGEIDHKDRNPKNNAAKNLRLATRRQNNINKAPSAGKSSRYVGVHWHRVTAKWAACIGLNNRTIHIGTFSDEAEAALAYDRKARELHGEFAVLNFPEDQ